MERKKLKPLRLVSLIISIIPAITLIPVFPKITLPDAVNTAWACVNIAATILQ